jgi:hypothetical protein
MDHYEAARTGQLSWFQTQKLQNTLPDLMEINTKDDRRLSYELAAANNHLEILQWMAEDSQQEIDFTENDWRVLYCALDCGSLAILRYLIEDQQLSTDFHLYSRHLYDIAKMYPYPEIRQYLESLTQAIESIGLEAMQEYWKLEKQHRQLERVKQPTNSALRQRL